MWTNCEVQHLTLQNLRKPTLRQCCWKLFCIFPATDPREPQICVNQQTEVEIEVNRLARPFDLLLQSDQNLVKFYLLQRVKSTTLAWHVLGRRNGYIELENLYSTREIPDNLHHTPHSLPLSRRNIFTDHLRLLVTCHLYDVTDL